MKDWERTEADLDAYIQTALQARTKVVQRIQQLESLDYCTGVLRWRTNDQYPTEPEQALKQFSADGTIKSTLYIDHTAGKPCPVHGIHSDPTKRLQKYIGVKHDKIIEAVTLVLTGHRLARAKATLASIDNMFLQIDIFFHTITKTCGRITIISGE